MKLVLKTPKTSGRILLCCTDTELAAKLSSELNSAGYDMTLAESTSAMIGQASAHSYDTIIMATAGIDYVQTAQKIKFEQPDLVLILLGTDEDITTDAQTLFYDLIPSQTEPNAIVTRVGQAVQYSTMQTEIRRLRQQVAMSYGFDNIVGDSDAIRKIKETAARVAPTDIPIMMIGASGTGRNLISKTIFHHSTRRKEKLVTIDCATIPQAMIDAELFGSDSTQDQSNDGLLAQADGGTLLIDNIQLLDSETQKKLLHLFKYKELMVTGDKPAQQLDIRILTVATTELLQMLSTDQFSEELFNHLGVIRLDLPTLTRRREDISQLCDYFLRTISSEQNCATPQIDRGAIELLMSYDWPGNVRELESSLKRAFALSTDGIIVAGDIILLSKSGTIEQIATRTTSQAGEQRTSRLVDSQKELITRALSDHDWNFTRTAEALGIGRTTLWRKVKKYNLQQETETVSS